jgi:phage tail sheath protein FI
MLFQLGQLNTTALAAPGEYVQIVPPQTRYINGVATNILGLVGVASWGAVNSPQLIGSPQDQANVLGQPNVRSYDLSTAVAVALQLGANNIRTVRVTDGTDAAASATLLDTATTPATGLTLTAFYTGTEGNKITAAITTGTQASTFKLTISRPGYLSEVFDNIGGAGATFWTNAANAVNNGQSNVRGPSQLAVASVGASTAAPNTTNTYTMSGGTDGASGVTNTTLVGTDGLARKGMYALRGSGIQTLNLVDHSDPTAWGTMATFGQAEGIFVGGQTAAGQTEAQTSSALNTAGTDSPWLKPLIGDWVSWQDNYNGVQRLLGPATFWAALRASLAPNQSTLNKPVLNLIGTQRSAQSRLYSNAELGQAATDRLDYLANPSAGGNYFSFQTDRNASSDPTRNSEAYTTMTNYLALTLAGAFGYVIGLPQTADLRNQVQNTIESFLCNLWRQGMIGDPNNPGKPPFTVQINAQNNPSSQVALGYMNAYVKVKYLSIVRYFVVSMEGGSSVSVTPSATPLF